jgi:hypothetical protein
MGHGVVFVIRASLLHAALQIERGHGVVFVDGVVFVVRASCPILDGYLA